MKKFNFQSISTVFCCCCCFSFWVLVLGLFVCFAANSLINLWQGAYHLTIRNKTQQWVQPSRGKHKSRSFPRQGRLQWTGVIYYISWEPWRSIPGECARRYKAYPYSMAGVKTCSCAVRETRNPQNHECLGSTWAQLSSPALPPTSQCIVAIQCI